MKVLVAATVMAGCVSPAFRMYPRDAAALQGGGRGTLRLDPARIVTRKGVLTFVRGKRQSPNVYARSVVVGVEGICFRTWYPVAGFWQAIRLEHVDPRIVSRVLQPRPSVTIKNTAAASYEVEGSNAALRAWVVHHLHGNADAQRNFVDLPAIGYAVRTTLGWIATDAGALERLAPTPSMFGEWPNALVGWRWNEIDRIDYFQWWPDSEPSDAAIDQAIAQNDYFVRRAIDARSGLSPGPCPLGPSQRLLLASAAEPLESTVARAANRFDR